MSDLRSEQTERESATWAEFEAALDRIPLERWTDEGVLPGWSIDALVWHVAGWMLECVGHLKAMRAGTFEEPDDSPPVVDDKNAAFAEAAGSMTSSAIRQGLLDARAELLRRWNDLPTIDDAAIEWFSGETYEHYEEHLPDLGAFAAAPRSDPG